MANVVLAIDMLRGFLEEGNPLFCGAASRSIIPKVQRLLAREMSRGSPLCFIMDSHDPDDLEFRIFPRHCVAGTEEAELVHELAGFPGERLRKKRYSGFFGTPLEQRLQVLQPDKLIVVGVCTDICVLHTVAGARNRDYTVEVPRDCVASFDERMHRFALEHMDKVLGAKITISMEEK